MKMLRSAMAVAALAATASAAAQSSVTVFGLADLSVRRVSNGSASTTSIASGGLAASRFGVRASEDLGGGLAAGAWLEGTVNVDDGTTNARFWNRRSTVSLSGRFGELRLGRELTPGYTAFGEFDVFGTSGLADQGKFYSSAAAVFGSGLDATGLWARADNAVSYYTPAGLGGFYAQLMLAAGEGVAAKKFRGGRIGYAAGPVHVTGAYSVVQGLAGDYKRGTVSGSWDLKTVKVLGSVTRNEYQAGRRLISQVGVHVPVFELGLVRVGITRVDASGRQGSTSIEGHDATQAALGYVHALSKRTSLYGTWTRITNKGGASFAVATPPAAGAGKSSSGVELGISHRF
jgi:predicted porin